VLVTLYLGPISLAMYVLSCKEPTPGAHDEFIRPLWKQGLGSVIHCVAGDATGIIIAATATAVLGLPMWVDLIAEYVFGFAFGLLIFQALVHAGHAGGFVPPRRAADRSARVAVDERQHGSMAMPAADHEGMDMRPRATRPQIAVVAILTVVWLIASLAYSASKVNLRIAGEEVKGAVMPPGMIMTNDTPAQAMRDMAAVDPDEVSYTAAADERGDRPSRHASRTV